jgi:hypothetical protein
MRGDGPIQPVRTRRGAPLLWRSSDIEQLLGLRESGVIGEVE